MPFFSKKRKTGGEPSKNPAKNFRTEDKESTQETRDRDKKLQLFIRALALRFMDYLTLTLGCSIGLAAGVLAGLFGIGGALLTTPAMRCLLGVPGLIALGTPLPIVIPTALSGGLVYYGRKSLRLRIALICGASGSLSALLGAWITDPLGGEAMMYITSGFIFLIALRFAFGKEKKVKSAGEKVQALPQLILIGLVGGFLSGFLGVGGGVILVPLFVILLGLEMHEAIGTSLAAISIYAIPGSIEHYLLGHIDLGLLIPIAAGCIVGAQLGARFAMLTKERKLKIGFAVFLVAVALYLGIYEYLA